MSPKFLSALLSLSKPSPSSDFSKGTFLESEAGLAGSECCAGRALARFLCLRMVRKGFLFWALGPSPAHLLSGPHPSLSSSLPHGPLPGRTWDTIRFPGGQGTETPSLPCLRQLHILEPRFPLLNFSQVKYSIGLLESKVLHRTD